MVLNQLKRFKEKIGMSKTDMGRDFRFWEGNRHFLHEIEKKIMVQYWKLLQFWNEYCDGLGTHCITMIIVSVQCGFYWLAY